MECPWEVDSRQLKVERKKESWCGERLKPGAQQCCARTKNEAIANYEVIGDEGSPQQRKRMCTLRNEREQFALIDR